MSFSSSLTPNFKLKYAFLVVFDKLIISAPRLFIVRLGQKGFKFELAIDAIIIFCKEHKKCIKWYVHFIGKSIIQTVKYLPS